MSTQQWANIGDDAGAPHALLQRVAALVPVPLIDYIWIFPARRIAIGESVVVVVGAFHEPERRRVITAHFTIARNRKGVATVGERFDEHGSTPPDAVPRIVQGVLRRLGEDIGADPREVLIDGRQDRWNEIIVELGGRPAPTEVPAVTEAGTGPAEPAQASAAAPTAGHDASAAGDHEAPPAGEDAAPAPGASRPVPRDSRP
jgi:hypothetical protein